MQVGAIVVMMRAAIILLALGLTAVTAIPTKQSVIVGGSITLVSQYPSVVALLYSTNGNNYNQACVGTIVTSNSILTAAHCVYRDTPKQWRARVGSSWANSGGIVYNLSSILIHPNFNIRTLDYDIAILKTASPIVYSNVVKQASIAGLTYNLTDNQAMWTVGWGTKAAGAPLEEQLRRLQAWSINQRTCASSYSMFNANVTANMLCFGWPNIGARDQCQGDSGAPIYHNGVLVGISSWGYGCANVLYPGVNTRVSQLAAWIQSNA